MKLITGLGNPGAQYDRTRHNIGFMVVDALADRLGWAAGEDFNRLARSKFEGLLLDGPFAGDKLTLLKPITFMNLSGRSVQAAMAFYKLEPADVLIVLDDLALPTGRLRLRKDGSDGGHNGLKDITRALNTQAYPRLRIGIDPPPPRVAGRDYVLGRFTPDQLASLDLPRAADACLAWATDGIYRAMNQFNVKDS